MRALILLLAALPACTLYVGDGADAALEDDELAPDAAAPDARPTWIDTDCAVPRPCPSPTDGRTSICGRLLDVETDARIEAEGASDLAIHFYDALDYAGDPTGASPLSADELVRDDCGRFAAVSLPRPSLGYLAVVVDDATDASDTHRATMIAFPVTSGQVIARLRAYSLRRSTDEAWTAQAGVGPSTFDQGAILRLFSTLDVPTPNVELAGALYFSDTDPSMRTTIDPNLTSTGPNGAALLFGGGSLTGGGGETGGCQWPSTLVAAIPGVLLMEPMPCEP